MDEYYEFLKNHPLFNHLTPDQLAKLRSVITTPTYSVGDFIIQEGEMAHDLFIICSGKVEILKKETENQNFYQIATLDIGAVLGEMSLLEENITRAATIRALETSHAISIPFAALHTFEKSESSETQLIYYRIVDNIAHELCARLRNANEILASSIRSDQEDECAKSAQGNFFASMWRF